VEFLSQFLPAIQMPFAASPVFQALAVFGMVFSPLGLNYYLYTNMKKEKWLMTRKMMNTSKLKVFKLLTLVMALAIFLGACKSRTGSSELSKEDVKEEMQEAADTTKAYLLGQHKMMVASYEARLELMEQQISSLRQEAEMTSANTKDQLNNTVNSLESDLDAVKDDLKVWKESTSDAWEELKIGVDEAVSELQESLDAAQDEFE
jgi:TolA-binding protein